MAVTSKFKTIVCRRILLVFDGTQKVPILGHAHVMGERIPISLSCKRFRR